MFYLRSIHYIHTNYTFTGPDFQKHWSSFSCIVFSSIEPILLGSSSYSASVVPPASPDGLQVNSYRYPVIFITNTLSCLPYYHCLLRHGLFGPTQAFSKNLQNYHYTCKHSKIKYKLFLMFLGQGRLFSNSYACYSHLSCPCLI